MRNLLFTSFAIGMFASSASACVSASGKVFSNSCGSLKKVWYCTPSNFRTSSGVLFKATCGRGSGRNKYYSHAFTLGAYETYTLPVRKERSVNYAICEYGENLTSDSSGRYGCD